VFFPFSVPRFFFLYSATRDSPIPLLYGRRSVLLPPLHHLDSIGPAPFLFPSSRYSFFRDAIFFPAIMFFFCCVQPSVLSSLEGVYAGGGLFCFLFFLLPPLRGRSGPPLCTPPAVVFCLTFVSCSLLSWVWLSSVPYFFC